MLHLPTELNHHLQSVILRCVLRPCPPPSSFSPFCGSLLPMQDPASLRAAVSDYLAHKAQSPIVDGAEGDAAPQERGILTQGTAFITDTSATNQVQLVLFLCWCGPNRARLGCCV